ncbi:MAG: acyl carrier protein [Rhizobiales bacterium]|nr:acyl carrier protein [Hyphomicrobiales bacterium]
MTKSEIENWMREFASNAVGINSVEIDLDQPLERYGLDSTAVAGMSGELSDILGVEIEPTIFFDYPTITSASEQISLIKV